MADNITFRYRKEDTPGGVTRRTVLSAAKAVGVSETQFIHLALARMLNAHDEADISDEAWDRMNQSLPPVPDGAHVVASLFAQAMMDPSGNGAT